MRSDQRILHTYNLLSSHTSEFLTSKGNNSQVYVRYRKMNRCPKVLGSKQKNQHAAHAVGVNPNHPSRVWTPVGTMLKLKVKRAVEPDQSLCVHSLVKRDNKSAIWYGNWHGNGAKHLTGRRRCDAFAATMQPTFRAQKHRRDRERSHFPNSGHELLPYECVRHLVK